jgi:hypothetical protein
MLRNRAGLADVSVDQDLTELLIFSTSRVVRLGAEKLRPSLAFADRGIR